MAMWHWGGRLGIDGDGIIQRHVRNLLYSRILEEEEQQSFDCAMM